MPAAIGSARILPTHSHSSGLLLPRKIRFNFGPAVEFLMAFSRRRGHTGADGDEVYGKTFRPLSEWTFARKDQLYQELEFKRFS